MYIHVVKKGENIHQIARAAGVKPEQVYERNGLLGDEHLMPGVSLLIPTNVPTTLVSYTVKEGDTLRKVANRHHLPEKLVLASNPPLQAESLPGGRVLTLPVPVRQKPRIEVNMRFEVRGEPDETATLREACDTVSNVSVATAWIGTEGAIFMPEEYDRPFRTFLQGRTKGKPLLLLAPVDEEAAVRAVCHAPSRRAFFQDLRLRMAPEEFAGVHLEMTSLPHSLRVQFNGFVRELAARVHQGGGRLFVAVRPQMEDDPDHPVCGAYDLKSLGRHADRIVWNADEGFGRADGPPMALAPLHLVRRSLNHALQVVPKSKLLLGLPYYGFDWEMPYKSEHVANLLLYGPTRLALDEESLPKQVLWDERALAPMFTYRDEEGEQREVWYEDVRSIGAKLHLVHELGLAGISCQVLGGAMAAQWSLLRDLFDVYKQEEQSGGSGIR